MNKLIHPRSACPINFTLEMIGDSWSLLILRDIVYFGKKTYGEFVSSEEGIARNILANRLERLQAEDILTKAPYLEDKRKDIYALTAKGLKLIPLLIEAAEWGATFGDIIEAPEWWLKAVQQDRDKILEVIYEVVGSGGAVFVGPDSVIQKLGLDASASSEA